MWRPRSEQPTVSVTKTSASAPIAQAAISTIGSSRTALFYVSEPVFLVVFSYEFEMVC
jgi:hypothetical protein